MSQGWSAATRDRNMSSASATRNICPYRSEPLWSRAERTIARTVFDAALKPEPHGVMQEARRRANRINERKRLFSTTNSDPEAKRPENGWTIK
jgi:hypothetical protein